MLLFFAVLSIFALNNVLASTKNACVKGTLSCDDGRQCVQSEKWCDKNHDCDDKSDEEYCKVIKWYTSGNPNECNDSYFVCSNGKCVPQSARCNDHDDCKDYSDEIGCEEEESTTKVITNEPNESEESVSEESSESSEESDGDISTGKQDENFVGRHYAVTQSSLTTQSTASAASSTQDYYRRRLIESEASKQTIDRQTSGISTRENRAPVTAPSLKVTPSQSNTRTTSNYHPSQHQTSRPNYPHRPQTYDQRQQTFHSAPTPYRPTQTYDRRGHSFPSGPTPYRPSQIYDLRVHSFPSGPTPYRPSQTYDQRRQTFHSAPSPRYGSSQTDDRRPPTDDRRPPTDDRQWSTYDRRPESYDRRQRPHSQTLDGRAQNHRDQSRPYAGRQSIFSNPASHPSNSRQYAADNGGNGEPDWREVASLKPYRGGTEVKERFYFAKNYADLFGRGNNRHVLNGAEWLLRQRNEAGDWGKDTARALVALSLTNNSFPSGNSDYELMKRKFQVQLSVDLLSNSTQELKVSKIAVAMNALSAVCENPRDFHSLDLAELLRIRIREITRNRGFPNPFVYLSLCLAGKPLTDSEVQNLMRKMTPSGEQLEIAKDMQSLAIQAFACHLKQVSSSDPAYLMSLQEKLNSAVSHLLSHMLDDGSFGSVYSTALAAQALISVNDSRGWNAQKTMNFLKQQQQDNGSFGDLLATYYVLPVLSGRSLLHLRNTLCTEDPLSRELTPSEILEYVGPKQFIHYSIYFGYPLVSSHSTRVLVPEGINFLDVMKVAAYQNENFKFSYQTGEENFDLYSISGTPNDAEQGLSWHLYVKDDSDPNQKELQWGERFSGDIKKLFPTSNKHMIFWYHTVGLQQ